MHSRRRAFFASTPLAILLMVLPAAAAQNGPEGPTGQVQQPLVGGLLTDPQTQQDFGLLTLNNPSGSCSASMLNDYWAITAAHCVFLNALTSGTQFTPEKIKLTANWPLNTRSANALQIVVFSGANFNTDIALLQMPRHAFDQLGQPERPLRAGRPTANLPLQAFGRGINQLAFVSGATPVPTQLDGFYRSAQFDIASIIPNSSAPPTTYSFPGRNGAIVAGGDSGGPSYYQDYDDPLSTRRKLQWQLVGVHSTCQTACLAGQSCAAPNFWTWASAVSSCSDAAIFSVRQAILDTIQAPPPDDAPTGTFAAIPDSVIAHRRALYAVSLDEPLIAPPNAAADIQLNFKQCHNSVASLAIGCPLDPSVQLWSYDPATHILYHVPSGKCLNISGARRSSGAPIILYPCTGAPNEKWSLVNPRNSSTWTIKSDLSGLCLEAVPGRGPGRVPHLTLATPAALTQSVCNNSASQQFADSDAAWTIRNGPR